MTEAEHDVSHCPGDDWEACIDGWVYTGCGSEFCNGLCENVGICGCICHRQPESERVTDDQST